MQFQVHRVTGKLRPVIELSWLCRSTGPRQFRRRGRAGSGKPESRMQILCTGPGPPGREPPAFTPVRRGGKAPTVCRLSNLCCHRDSDAAAAGQILLELHHESWTPPRAVADGASDSF